MFSQITYTEKSGIPCPQCSKYTTIWIHINHNTTARERWCIACGGITLFGTDKINAWATKKQLEKLVAMGLGKQQQHNEEIYEKDDAFIDFFLAIQGDEQ